MWEEAGERQFFGPAMIEEEAENVAKVRENLRIAQSCQKSYADKCRRELIFEAGEFVYLKVSPLRGTKRFHMRGKLAPRYVGPYRIKKKIGELAYELELPEHLSEAVDLQDNLEYLEDPVQILDRAEKRTRRTRIPVCKVLWSNHSEREATWEKESELREKYPHLFENMGVSQGGLRYWRAGFGDKLDDDHFFEDGNELDDDLSHEMERLRITVLRSRTPVEMDPKTYFPLLDYDICLF
ncbi:hypothetical protein U9M48_036609 [Paspalum notatum var. saurae]|uniref:Tf2-1-like SH3-like domain-containing protein n=1 Tax=Paspalum notatum var. saurae TaxID=547442 RepID=A0AAQ3UDG5_PASNO